MDTYENGLHSEIIDIANEDRECNELAKFPHSVESAAGGLVNGKPMICGGFNQDPITGTSNKCFVIGGNQSVNMEYERSYPSSISISRDKVSYIL